MLRTTGCGLGPAGKSVTQLSQGSKMSMIVRFLRNESGATAIEYGLIAAGISVAIIATVSGLGGKLKDTFAKVDGALN